MSIASELTTLATNKVNIKSALVAMNPITPPTDVLAQWPDSIASIPVERQEFDITAPVRFFDSDGTLLHSYAVDTAQQLSKLPALPTRPGLTCQGWNYTLAEMKSCLGTFGACDVGAVYVPTDGKTHIKLEISHPEYTTAKLCFTQTVANGVTIDWGDGSASESDATTTRAVREHTYAPSSYPTTYDVTLDVTSGKVTLGGNATGYNIIGSSSSTTTYPANVYVSMVKEVNIGSGMTDIAGRTFQSCYYLQNVTIPNGITSIETTSFHGSGIKFLTIPSGVTTIGASAFA